MTVGLHVASDFMPERESSWPWQYFLVNQPPRTCGSSVMWNDKDVGLSTDPPPWTGQIYEQEPSSQAVHQTSMLDAM